MKTVIFFKDRRKDNTHFARNVRLSFTVYLLGFVIYANKSTSIHLNEK